MICNQSSYDLSTNALPDVRRLVYVPFNLIEVKTAGMRHSSLTQQSRGVKGTLKARIRHTVVACPICHEDTVYLSISTGVKMLIQYWDNDGVTIESVHVVRANGHMTDKLGFPVTQVVTLVDGQPTATVRGKGCWCEISAVDTYAMLAAAELAARPVPVVAAVKAIALDPETGQPVKAKRGRPPGANNVNVNARYSVEHKSIEAHTKDREIGRRVGHDVRTRTNDLIAHEVNHGHKSNHRAKTLKVGSAAWVETFRVIQPVGSVAAWPDTHDTWHHGDLKPFDFATMTDYLERTDVRFSVPVVKVAYVKAEPDAPADVVSGDEITEDDSIEILAGMELADAAELSFANWGPNE
jgi:hypothetical protein